ncbi:MAG TPA: spore gernimation protein GerMN, partial [Thermoclostridium sp.]|nr:spore gernimation protein GerMN [Thermoclostridium sp.]
VEVEKDIVLSAEQIKEALDSEQLYIWGAYDGIGEPIELTFAEYMARFVYNQDFLIADEVLFDQYFERGNTINNVFDAYANAHVLEYYYRGFNPEYEGMDWESLKLVFEQKDGKWYLTGVVHDQWTI